MHELRSIVAAGGRSTILAKREPKPKRPDEGPSLTSLSIQRTEARSCNQRREDRHLNVVESAEVTFRRRKHEVPVINVSRHGAMLERCLEPRIGERMEIRFDGCNRTECTVRWIRGSRIGVEFARETVIIAPAQVRELIVSGRRDGETVAPEPESDERPDRAPRQSLFWKAVLHWDHGTAQVRIRNISAEGAMLECRQDLIADTEVVLDLGEGGTAPGTVRWSRGGHVGVQFDERFDMRHLVRTDRTAEHSPHVVKPAYLESENDPSSPWASAWEKLTPEALGERDPD
ncbi:PilZ domain-containing protein [Allosphingosinicella sp.]|jgi:hypothetical protein|uniref:PilZ domain-containing protein n=1 Tax=Allosphingosinicella sp. TaxID=2823234 RepID=UPI002EDD6191